MLLTKDYQTPSSLQASNENKPLGYVVSSLSKVDINILYQLFSYDALYEDIFFARKTVAEKLEISVCTFSRRTNLLHDQGFIIKSRPQGKPFDVCHYKLTDETIAQKKRIMCLFKYFKGLGFALGLLVSSPQVQDSIAPLYSYNVFSNGVFGVVPGVERELQTARETKQATPDTTISKKGQQVEVPKHILDLIPKMQLTKHGQVKLMALPQESIEHGLEHLKQKTESTNVFRTLYDAASAHAIENNLTIDWYSYYKALEDGVAKKEDFYTAKKISHKQMFSKPSSQNKSKPSQTSPELFKKESERLRQATRDRMALNLPEDIALERAYLLANPTWLEEGRSLGVDLSKWGLQENTKPVTEIKENIVLPQNEEEDRWWDDVPLDLQGEHEEIY